MERVSSEGSKKGKSWTSSLSGRGKSLERRKKSEGEGCFYSEERTVDLLRHTPGINLFEPNKREQLNSP